MFKTRTAQNKAVLFLLIFLASCGGADSETIEVTRVVTETVEIEGEPVEVEATRVVTETETVVEEMEEAMEEEAVDEESAAEPPAEEEVAEDDQPGDFSAVGSEDGTGDVPPTPQNGPKVESTRTAQDASGLEPIEARAAAEETAVSPTPSDESTTLTAGERNDNADFAAYLNYLEQYAGDAIIPIRVNERYEIRVIDDKQEPINAALLTIVANGKQIAQLRTHADGSALFFPQAYGASASIYRISAAVNQQEASAELKSGATGDALTIVLPDAQRPLQKQLDILFLIDATGSMGDEIAALKSNFSRIVSQIHSHPGAPDVRYGMIAYRDRGDAYLTQQTPFTESAADFVVALDAVEASGGGDYAEDVQTALSEALNEMAWRTDQSIKLIFLVADAPPHLDYNQDYTYAHALHDANLLGVKLYPIASSGLNAQGEYIFRQMAQITSGRFIFLVDESIDNITTGDESFAEANDYTVAALDDIILNIVTKELNHP